MDNTITPAIGKIYKVIAGSYTGFKGECVSLNLDDPYPILLVGEFWASKAVKLDEVEELKSAKIGKDNKIIE
jgi:hypothetical protein